MAAVDQQIRQMRSQRPRRRGVQLFVAEHHQHIARRRQLRQQLRTVDCPGIDAAQRIAHDLRRVAMHLRAAVMRHHQLRTAIHHRLPQPQEPYRRLLFHIGVDDQNHVALADLLEIRRCANPVHPHNIRIRRRHRRRHRHAALARAAHRARHRKCVFIGDPVTDDSRYGRSRADLLRHHAERLLPCRLDQLAVTPHQRLRKFVLRTRVVMHEAPLVA